MSLAHKDKPILDYEPIPKESELQKRRTWRKLGMIVLAGGFGFAGLSLKATGFNIDSRITTLVVGFSILIFAVTRGMVSALEVRRKDGTSLTEKELEEF
jgi:hypothetical protein